ncbi:MAG: CPBP family intramembrane glutamic endopeptidase, partial [Polyangiaceae bacterium]
LILAAPFIGLAAAIATTVVSPNRDRIERDILEALALTPESQEKPPPKSGAIWGALAIAIFLPLALLVSGRAFGLWGQAIAMMLWGLLLPQRAVPDVDRLAPQRSPYFSWSNVFSATIVGVALTAALSGGAHYGVDAVAHAVQCTHTAASSGAAHLLARESAEVSRNVNEAQHDLSFFLMTAFLAPLIEERVYRGALQRILGQRFGSSRAIGMAASVFGFAHLGVYRVAIYQTLLLGVAFGVAFEEGGLIASILTHVIWNAYLLL